MKVVYSEKHILHAPQNEVCGGEVLPCFEKPERAFNIYNEIIARGLGETVAPESFPDSHILRIHEPGYVTFLQNAYREWQEAGFNGDAYAHAYNVQHPGSPVPVCIEGKLGYYTSDGTLGITPGTWEGLRVAVDVTLTAQQLVQGGASAAFALVRPPGHHATASVAAGYCFLNNAAIAAQAFLDGGAKRVAILDVDYHHGNGTQEIFYQRNDVLFTSLHADPAHDYPYFRGYAEETGAGKGEGFTANFPLPLGTDWQRYREALRQAIGRIAAYKPDALVISLGVDTFAGDPISKFTLQTDDFTAMGQEIAGLNLPALFVMEGGYAVEDIGNNVANVLSGFCSISDMSR